MKGATYGCGISHQTFVMESSRVILTGSDYDPCDEDPVAGTEWECEGTVMSFNDGREYPMNVAWDNETNNDYHPQHLEIVGEVPVTPSMEENNPNKTFRAQKKSCGASIWTGASMTGAEVAKIREVIIATGTSIIQAKASLEFFEGSVEKAIAQLTKPTHISTNQHATTENENNALPIQTVQTGINQHATTENSDEIPPNVGGIVINSVVAHNPCGEIPAPIPVKLRGAPKSGFWSIGGWEHADTQKTWKRTTRGSR